MYRERLGIERIMSACRLEYSGLLEDCRCTMKKNTNDL